MDNTKQNEDKRSPKNDSSQKKGNFRTDMPERQQVGGVKREPEDQTERSPQAKKDQSEQKPAIPGRTEQIMAEAAAEKQPEEKMADVLLDIPTLKVEEIKLNVDNLDARVSLRADLANFVRIDIGAHVGITKVDLDIKGVEAQAILKVRLKQVYAILSRALETIDKNPELLVNILKPVEEGFGTAEKNAGAGKRNAFDELKSGVNNTKEPNGLSMGSVDAEDAEGVKAQTGKVNEAIGDVSNGVDRSVETGSNVKEEDRRKFTRIDKK